jgi:hypothetical protein
MDRDRMKGKSKIVVGGIKAKAGEIAGNDELNQSGDGGNHGIQQSASHGKDLGAHGAD